jgi:hypothetical protein
MLEGVFILFWSCVIFHFGGFAGVAKLMDFGMKKRLRIFGEVAGVDSKV